MTNFRDIEISLSQQCMFFIWSIAVGVALGVFYDIFRIFRIAVKQNGIAIFFEDLLFCTAGCAVLILMIFCANYGTVRWFSIFGVVGGFYVYYNTLGRIVMRAASAIITFIKKYIIAPIQNFILLALSFFAHLLLALFRNILTLFEDIRIVLFKNKIIRLAKKGFNL